ncbi:unnamed protein product, partial [Hydatigera taeniaeformis]|uniref:C2H2-type domain-containing protein n=1 Tax=Hydatigena taeniaeformis TaxID=6205 RepID=A0A0R3XCS7_HYDTA
MRKLGRMRCSGGVGWIYGRSPDSIIVRPHATHVGSLIHSHDVGDKTKWRVVTSVQCSAVCTVDCWVDAHRWLVPWPLPPTNEVRHNPPPKTEAVSGAEYTCEQCWLVGVDRLGRAFTRAHSMEQHRTDQQKEAKEEQEREDVVMVEEEEEKKEEEEEKCVKEKGN